MVSVDVDISSDLPCRDVAFPRSVCLGQFPHSCEEGLEVVGNGFDLIESQPSRHLNQDGWSLGRQKSGVGNSLLLALDGHEGGDHPANIAGRLVEQGYFDFELSGHGAFPLNLRWDCRAGFVVGLICKRRVGRRALLCIPIRDGGHTIVVTGENSPITMGSKRPITVDNGLSGDSHAEVTVDVGCDERR